MSLKQKTLTGIKWTTLSAIVVTILQLLQLSILAKFLVPSAFGLMAISMVIIGFSQAFLDMGISNAIIHKQQIDHEQLSTLYWVNVLAGTVLFLIITLSAPFIADFYNEPELINIIIIVGITFLIQPFGQQFMVLFQKELRFEAIAKIDIVNKLTSLIVSVWFAYLGYGVYALVYGVLSGATIQTLLFMIAGLKEHRPSFIFKPGAVREFLHFGAYQMGEKAVNYFNTQFDTILIGKLLGAESLGIYTIAKELIMRPSQIINPIITKITFPVMSKMQNDERALRNIYLKTVNYLASINFPLYALIILLASELILLLFGEAWIDAIPVLQILAIYAAIRSIGNPIGSLLLAKGKAKLGFYWNLGLFFFVPLSIYFYSNWGLLGVSWGLVLNMMIFQLPGYYILVHPLCGAGFKEYFKQILKPLILVLTAGVLSYSIGFLFAINNMIVYLFIITIIMTVIMLLLNILFNREFINMLRQLLGTKGNRL